MNDLNEQIWTEIIAREGKLFTDHKGNSFSYHIRRTKAGSLLSEMQIDGKTKSITRATALLAYHRMLELLETKGEVKGHRKLGAYGSEYLYPVFQDIYAGNQKEETPSGFSAGPAEPVRLLKVCGTCGFSTEEDFSFCPKCGALLQIREKD